MENKYITVAYKLYGIKEGQSEMVEEATVEHPFQFISGLGSVLERFEAEIAPLNEGDKFEFIIPCAEAMVNTCRKVYVQCLRTCSLLMVNLMTNASTLALSFLCRTMKVIISLRQLEKLPILP